MTHHDLIREPLASDPRVFETGPRSTVSGPQVGRSARPPRLPELGDAHRHPIVLTSAAEDFYVTLLAYDPDSGAITLRLFINPLVTWIWVGGAVVVPARSPSGPGGGPRGPGCRPAVVVADA